MTNEEINRAKNRKKSEESDMNHCPECGNRRYVLRYVCKPTNFSNMSAVYIPCSLCQKD